MAALPANKSLHISYRSHAKINLMLHVLDREESGFHSIETLFQRIALHDTVHVEIDSRTRSIECDGPSIPKAGIGLPEHNLAWRAADLYSRETGWDCGWKISLNKQIPIGGGLGGGSSNAATTLMAMNALTRAPVPKSALIEMAGELGSDVPFFVSEYSLALAWSRGNRLLELKPLPPANVLLATFDAGINTAEAYESLSSARAKHATKPLAGMRQNERAESSSMAYPLSTFTSWQSIATVASNDFQSHAVKTHAGIASVLPLLRAEALRLNEAGAYAVAMMSGSGATCYLLYPKDIAPSFTIQPSMTGRLELIRTRTC